MGGSRESFVRSLRHHVLEDVQEAELRLRTRVCRCAVRQCDRYFAETRILRGLKLITLQWDSGSQSLFMDGRGMGYVDLKDGLRDLRERNGVTQARDEAEAIWRNWERQGLPREPGAVASIRQIWDRVKKSEIGEDQGFTNPIALSIIHGPSPP